MPTLLAEAAQVLGVELTADGGPPDAELIASAFKKLAIRWHPDRNPESLKEATEIFAEISAARDILVDPPAAALADEPAPNRGGKSASSQPNLREFVGDVSEQIDSRKLSGEETVRQFEGFALWAVWKCDKCEAVCCRIRKNKYSCMCSHRLRDHDAGNGFRCSVAKCGCKRYSFMVRHRRPHSARLPTACAAQCSQAAVHHRVCAACLAQVQDATEPHRCRCKHKPSEHASTPPYACRKCEVCTAFDSPWVCNCGHKPSDHRTCFVREH